MFDMQNIGRKISALRKERDMTQMELADQMGISFQAVSNWERGNSMPDIGKLPELAKILNVSVDELLGDEKAAGAVEKALQPETHGPMNPQEFAQVAPLMKPRQAEEAADRIDFSGLSLKDVLTLAPFISQKTIDKLALKAAENENAGFRDLCCLAPFMSRDVIDKLFLSGESQSVSKLAAIAPFVSMDAMDAMVARLVNQEDVSMNKLAGLAPFMSRETLRWVAKKGIDRDGFRGITALLPFLGKDFLEDSLERSSYFQK